MGYSTQGRRPFEAASKSSHHHIINDPAVQALVKRLHVKPRAQKSKLADITVPIVVPAENPVEHIIAIDGGYTEAVLEKEFPSRLLHFLQFGALWFRREDLAALEKQEFISPEDMAKL